MSAVLDFHPRIANQNIRTSILPSRQQRRNELMAERQRVHEEMASLDERGRAARKTQKEVNQCFEYQIAALDSAYKLAEAAFNNIGEELRRMEP